jgi:hypothetical protein
VNFENNNTIPEQQGYTTEDILWAVGIWSVILTLSPVVVFYMLMVAGARDSASLGCAIAHLRFDAPHRPGMTAFSRKGKTRGARASFEVQT